MKGDDYEVVKVIGRGAFGEVQLVSVLSVVVIYAAVTHNFVYVCMYIGCMYACMYVYMMYVCVYMYV